jgi:hypothetical protein
VGQQLFLAKFRARLGIFSHQPKRGLLFFTFKLIWSSLLRESQSAMEIQQQELPLAQKKIEEKSRVGGLRLEEDAAVAVAKAHAIDKELSLEDHQDPEHFDQNYINSQLYKFTTLQRI